MKYDVVIVGSGPAGMSAALYLKRANISCCIIEKGAPGGQMNQTAIIENYPGISKITGPELSLSMWKQLTDLKTDYIYDTVTKIEVKEQKKIVYTNTKEIECQFIILASGKSPKKLGLANEEKLNGRGVSSCAICDGALYKGKIVAVVGGSTSALEESLYLSNLCSKVYLLHRRDIFREEGKLLEKVKEKSNIEILTSCNITSLKEDHGKLKGIAYQQGNRKDEKILDVSGLFVFIGQFPNTKFVENLSIVEKDGFILVNEEQESKIPGIFAVGDVVKKEAFQIVIASAEGTKAALAIIKRKRSE